MLGAGFIDKGVLGPAKDESKSAFADPNWFAVFCHAGATGRVAG
jgi:hypothetical protein